VQGFVDIVDAATGDLVDQMATAQEPLVIIGTNNAPYGAIACGMLLQLVTNVFVGGRRLRGRAYVSPVCQGNDQDGSPDAGMSTLVQAIGTALMDVGIGGGPELVVWRRPRKNYVGKKGPLPDRPGTVAPVLGTSVPDEYVVMRSRR
jgi:hypothetical protein